MKIKERKKGICECERENEIAKNISSSKKTDISKNVSISTE